MNRQALESQANQLEAALARHKVAARVTGGQLSSRWIRYQVQPAPGTELARVEGLSVELALALDSRACRVSRQNGTLTVQVARPDPQPVWLLPLQRRLKKLAPGAALLGLDDDGAPLLLRLPSPQVGRLLIAGAPGAGKSALARTIITSLALNHQRDELGLVLVDSKEPVLGLSKGSTFGPLAALPHLLKPVLSKPQEASQVLQALIRLVHKRGDKLQAPRVVLVIDDLADLLAATGDSTRQALVLLAQRGHEAGVHLIACTSKPAAILNIEGITLDNFPTRLVGRVASPEQAQEATGYAGTGAERLKAPGDFLAVTGGQIMPFQAAYVTARQIAEVASQILNSLPVKTATAPPRQNGKVDGINLPQVPVVTPAYPLPPIRHRGRERIDL